MNQPLILPIETASKSVLAELKSGKCVAMPTETVYGLAADATNGEAVAKIFKLKGRPSFNPLIAHVSGLAMGMEHGIFGTKAKRLAETFWPGPLTLVVPKNAQSDIHDLCSAGLDTIGLRCPQGYTREIIVQFGRPIAAPSANKSGKISPTKAIHVAQDFADEALLILDGGNCDIGLESTIVKVLDDEFAILRHGSITASMIEAATGAKLQQASNDIQAPGMMESHYAPSAGVLLEWNSIPDNAGLLSFGSNCGLAGFVKEMNLSQSGNLNEAASNLYAHLKELDAEDIDVICVSAVPSEGLGIAINDRIKRAAAPRGN